MLLLWRIEYKNLLVITRGAAVSKLHWYIYSNLVNTRELYNITYIRPLLFWSNQILRFLLFFVQRIAKFWWHRILFCFSAKRLQNHKIKVFAKYAASYSETSAVSLPQPRNVQPLRWAWSGLAKRRLTFQTKGDVTRGDSQRRFLAQHSIAALLRHCFEWLQHCSNIARLCCAKNRLCDSSCVTSPLKPLANGRNIVGQQLPTIRNNMQQDVQTDATCNILIQQCCVRLHGVWQQNTKT